MDLVSLRPQHQILDKAQLSETGAYGVHDLMTKGLDIFFLHANIYVK